MSSTVEVPIKSLQDELFRTSQRMNKLNNALIMLNSLGEDIICRDELISLDSIHGLKDEYPKVAILLKKKALEVINKVRTTLNAQKMLIQECGSVEKSRMEVERLNIVIEELKIRLREIRSDRKTQSITQLATHSESQITTLDSKLSVEDGKLMVTIQYDIGVIEKRPFNFFNYEIKRRTIEANNQKEYLKELRLAMEDPIFAERTAVYEILKRIETTATRSYEFMEKKIRDYQTVYDDVVQKVVSNASLTMFLEDV